MGTPAPMPSGLVLFVISFGVLVTFVLLLWLINTLKDRPWERAHMSSASAKASPESAPTPVHVPVPRTDTDLSGIGSAAASGMAEEPDTSAANTDTDDWEMPRISSHLSDRELVVMLARQKLPGGKYRLSANAIYDLIKGPRAEVLAIVREVREGPAQYAPLDADGRQVGPTRVKEA